MVRMSCPRSSRWVERHGHRPAWRSHEDWQKVWQVTGFLIPADCMAAGKPCCTRLGSRWVPPLDGLPWIPPAAALGNQPLPGQSLGMASPDAFHPTQISSSRSCKPGTSCPASNTASPSRRWGPPLECQTSTACWWGMSNQPSRAPLAW
jgi:hypothetical protein